MSGCPIRCISYYYADQGPTYSGPGNFAPVPTYQEGAISNWGAYRHHPYYHGYNGHHWHHHMGYGYPVHRGVHYGTRSPTTTAITSTSCAAITDPPGIN